MGIVKVQYRSTVILSQGLQRTAHVFKCYVLESFSEAAQYVDVWLCILLILHAAEEPGYAQSS